MLLVEQHVIGKGDSRYVVIDMASFASKNLYNAANYELRQAFIFEHRYIGMGELDKRMQQHEAYCSLPRKVSQQVLHILDKNWQSFFAAIKQWRITPEKFLGRPKLPKYKDKTDGRKVLVYTIQAISARGLKRGVIQPSGLPIEVATKQHDIAQVRIAPRNGHYVVEVVYEKAVQQANVDSSLYAGIDIGLNNLAAITSNKVGFIPQIVNGRPLKSINQYYNKERSRLQSILSKDNRFTSKQLDRLTNKRTRKIMHYLHNASRKIVDLLVAEKIGTLVIGKNENWKQDINIGKRNNQNFVSIPHARFINLLTYKAKLVGIQVILTEESYTSKCSFLDNEVISKHKVYCGKRVKRGLFRTGQGKFINADVNGSFNIIRKVAPESFDGVEGVVVHPVRLHVQILKSRIS